MGRFFAYTTAYSRKCKLLVSKIRALAERFEHRLFLSATPHNGHSNSFSSLLEILDPQRFTRGVPVDAGLLDDVMVRRLKSDLVKLGVARFPNRDIEPIVLAGLPADAPELALAEQLESYRNWCETGLEGPVASRMAFVFSGRKRWNRLETAKNNEARNQVRGD